MLWRRRKWSWTIVMRWLVDSWPHLRSWWLAFVKLILTFNCGSRSSSFAQLATTYFALSLQPLSQNGRKIGESSHIRLAYLNGKCEQTKWFHDLRCASCHLKTGSKTQYSNTPHIRPSRLAGPGRGLNAKKSNNQRTKKTPFTIRTKLI